MLDKIIFFSLFIVHIGCIFAPFHFTWHAFCLAFALYVVTGLSISVSYHRNLAHRSFKLPKLLEYFLAYCAAHALQVWHMIFYFLFCLWNVIYFFLLVYFFIFFRVIQLIGWAHIGVITNLSIQKKTHIVLSEGFGLAISLGFLIPIIWPKKFVQNILPIFKKLIEAYLYGSQSTGDPIMFVIWRSKYSIGLFIKHIFFITFFLQSYSFKLEDFHFLYGAR